MIANASREVKELIMKYFTPKMGLLQPSSPFYDYLTDLEKPFNKVTLISKKLHLQDLCNEKNLSENIYSVLYFVGLHYKKKISFNCDMDTSFAEDNGRRLEIIEMLLLFYDHTDSNNPEDLKFSLSYKEAEANHLKYQIKSAEIKNIKTIIDIRELLTEYFINDFIHELETFSWELPSRFTKEIVNEMQKDSQQKNRDLKLTRKFIVSQISKEYLRELQKEIKQISSKAGRKKEIKFIYPILANTINFLQEETLIKKDSKIISEEQAIFLFRYLKIFEFIEYESKYDNPVLDSAAEAAYIRAIIQRNTKKEI